MNEAENEKIRDDLLATLINTLYYLDKKEPGNGTFYRDALKKHNLEDNSQNRDDIEMVFKRLRKRLDLMRTIPFQIEQDVEICRHSHRKLTMEQETICQLCGEKLLRRDHGTYSNDSPY